MCKRTFYFMSLISAVVIVSGTVWTYAGDDDDFGRGLGFGRRIAGTYYSAPGGIFGTGALSLHADGTLIGVSATCCGSGASDNVQSEGIGNWVRTGSRQIELSAVVLATNYDEVEGIPLPLGNVVCEVSQQWDFESDFQSYTGSLVTACWNADPDGIPDLLDPERRDPDLCTADFPPELFEVSGERFPVRFPACD